MVATTVMKIRSCLRWFCRMVQRLVLRVARELAFELVGLVVVELAVASVLADFAAWAMA